MTEEKIRSDFERFISNDGKWPQAIERDGSGNYIFMQTASAWHVWRNAYHQCLQSPEFISTNDIPVSVATIKRGRMEEILREAIEADRQQRGEPVGRNARDAIHGLQGSIAVGSDGEWVSIRRDARDTAIQRLRELSDDYGKAYGEMPTTTKMMEPVGHARKDQLDKVRRGWSHMCQIQPEPQQGTVAIYTDPQPAASAQAPSDAHRKLKERTEYLLRGHKAIFNQGPKKVDLQKHIKTLDAENDRLLALLARYGATQPSVPEGWQLVPVEPTREMLDAYVAQDGRFHSARADWATMLEAAPKFGEEE